MAKLKSAKQQIKDLEDDFKGAEANVLAAAEGLCPEDDPGPEGNGALYAAVREYRAARYRLGRALRQATP